MSESVLPAMFACPRTNMRLTAAGCARLWTAANDPDHNAKNGNNRRQKSYRPEPWEGKAACWHCPIGAKHAGADFNSRPLSDIMRNRCGATGAVASRLVAGMREHLMSPFITGGAKRCAGETPAAVGHESATASTTSRWR